MARKKKNFEKLLVDYLKSNYDIGIEKMEGRSWLRLPSGITLYVNGSVLEEPWYDLDKKFYDKLIGDSKSFYVIVWKTPEQTFVIPSNKLKDLFDSAALIRGR